MPKREASLSTIAGSTSIATRILIMDHKAENYEWHDKESRLVIFLHGFWEFELDNRGILQARYGFGLGIETLRLVECTKKSLASAWN
jgi:hypothetical protein